jgi:hypothetical protein
MVSFLEKAYRETNNPERAQQLEQQSWPQKVCGAERVK